MNIQRVKSVFLKESLCLGLLLFSGEQRGSSVLAFSLDLLYSERQKNEGRARPVQIGCLQCVRRMWRMPGTGGQSECQKNVRIILHGTNILWA